MRPLVLVVGLVSGIASGGALAAESSSTDFYVSSSYVQHIARENIRKLVVNCFCYAKKATESSAVKDLEFQVVGSYSSMGYHGKQDTPKSVPIEFLAFKVSGKQDVARAESHEFTFIHHSFILTSVEVIYPPGVTVVFEPVPESELEGRHIE